MMKFNRPNQPRCLAIKSTDWTTRWLADKKKSQVFRWYNAKCKTSVSQALSQAHARHCAFCDLRLALSSTETIEHFKPKSTFPELAFVWDNLYPACTLCQRYKLEKFDDRLLRPDDTAYSFDTYFMIDYSCGKLKPNSRLSPVEKERAEKTIELYGLNEAGRPQARFDMLEDLDKLDRSKQDKYDFRYLFL
ncbi:MAG: TIGR02646 family protein [Magnetococcales bacterium]|nr:TIGR02646 family protein [Magnetococcales bacterium]